MNRAPQQSIVGLVVAELALAVALPIGEVHGQCVYEATIIQAPECQILGVPPIEPRGISSLGHVAGWHKNCKFSNAIAFFWTPTLGLVEIPFPAGTISRKAEDINSYGRIVGSANFASDELASLAFVFENGKLTNLGTIPGGNRSEAVAVNECGQVVGSAQNFQTGDPPFTPFLWEGGALIPLDLPFGPEGRASDINDNGQVVGWMGNGILLDSHGYIWEAGVVTDLGVPPGAFAAEAVAINNAGQVLIKGRFQDNATSPVLFKSFLWDDGQWTDIGLLPGFDRCTGIDLNDSAQIVGYCQHSSGTGIMGFFWQDGEMIPVTDLDLSIPGGAAIGLPCALGETGQIALDGSFQGGQAIILLTPINQPLGDVAMSIMIALSVSATS